ncbi:MAG TPA: hypothetical protein VLG76_01965 [Rhabdochlamydiaceae bacterium]|nr:hypothetical protein [Rhabdochlamydiaceae bacterium]
MSSRETQPLLFTPQAQNVQNGSTTYGTEQRDVRIKIKSAARARMGRGRETQIKNKRQYKELTTDVKVAVAIFILLTCPISLPLILISRYCARKETSKDRSLLPPVPQAERSKERSTECLVNVPGDNREAEARSQISVTTVNPQTPAPAAPTTATVNPPTRGPIKSCLVKTRIARLKVTFDEEQIAAQQLGPQLSSNARGALKREGISETIQHSIIGANEAIVVIEVQALSNQRDEAGTNHALDTDGATEMEAEQFIAGPVSINAKTTPVPIDEDDSTPGDLTPSDEESHF